ncbi:MAG TPA: hypothetical protein VFD59_03425 [Nocardioidaceae bacterium]|nr:hypothetical protein [Nocardioidaceae bacterium]
MVGYLARKQAIATADAADADGGSRADVRHGGWPDAGFLDIAEPSADVRSIYDGDVAEVGYVINASKLWAHLPPLHTGLFDLIGQAVRAGSLTFRQRGILVTACASALGDSYCSLAWGKKLAGEVGADVAAGVLLANDDGLDSSERTLARWARKVTPRAEHD